MREESLGRSGLGWGLVKREMPLQEDLAASIHRGLYRGDIQIWVARSDHDIPRRDAGPIGSPAWRGARGGSDQNQQRDDSHVGMMRPGGNENK